MPPAETLDGTPLCQVFAIAAALHANNGGKFAQPDYYEEELFDGLP
jgi:hypothetical protein